MTRIKSPLRSQPDVPVNPRDLSAIAARPDVPQAKPTTLEVLTLEIAQETT
jgi:hypothetical protein